MDGITADPNAGADGAAAGEIPAAEPVEDGPDDGERTLRVTLAGFSGPLDHLLALARAQKINLAEISLAALADQLADALRLAPVALPLGRKGDWVVMTAWLVQLRSLLLLPTDAPGRQDAAAAADQLRDRLAALQEMQALAGWLEHRPQLGRDAFVRGRPELFGVSVDAGPAIDVVEFLWAGMALFDDTEVPDAAPVYRPPLHLELYAAVEAQARILHRLAEAPDEHRLDTLLPEAAGAPRSILRRRSAWSSTLIASLELAKQGEVVLRQDADFQPIHVARA
jgi:segregation and condensation protein A